MTPEELARAMAAASPTMTPAESSDAELFAQAMETARVQDTPMERTRELTRAAVRGPVEAQEMYADVGEGFPGLAGVPSRVLNAAVAAVGGDMSGFEPRNIPSMVLGPELAGFFGFNSSESQSADRLRAQAREATGITDLTKRRLITTDPTFEAAVRGTEATSSALASGGALNVPGAIASAASGVGTGVGRYIAEQQDLSPGATAVVETVGSVAGGVTPLLASPQRIGAAVSELASRARAAVTNWNWAPGKTIPEHIRREAVETLRSAAELGGTSLDDLVTRIRTALDNDDLGTLATLADDPALRGLERQLPASMEKTAAQTARGALTQAREQTAAAAQRRFEGISPTGDPEAATRAAIADVTRRGRRSVAAGQTLSERGARQQAAAAGVRDDLERARVAQPDVEESGLQLNRAIEGARERAKEAEQLAWSQVPEDELIPKGTANKAIDDVLEGMNSTDRALAERTFAPELALVRNLDDQVTGAELNSIRSEIGASMTREAQTGGASTNTDRLGKELNNALREVIDEGPGGELVQAARAASRERIRTFETGALGATRRAVREERGGSPALTARRLTGTQEGAGARIDDALTAEQFTEPGAIRTPLEQSLRAQFLQATSREGGEPSTTAANNWIKANRTALKRFPGLAAELRQSARALGQADEAAREGGELIRQGERVRRAGQTAAGRSAAAQFIRGGQGPEEAAIEALNASDRVRRFTQLGEAARRAGPEAQEGLRAAVRNALIERFSMRDRLDATTRRALTRVLTPDDVEQVDRAYEMIARLNADELVDPARVLQRESGAIQSLGVALARIAGAKVGGIVSGQPLIASNMASNAAREFAERIPNRQFQQALLTYMIDPRRFADEAQALARRRLPGVEVSDILERIFARAAGTTGAAATVREEE